MLTKTDVRKQVSRGKFTSVDYADSLGVTRATARNHIRKLTEAGVIEPLGESAKVLNDEGEPQRGRPRHLFRVASGK